MNNASASEILRQIVAIPSVNPALADDPALRGEARLVEFLEPWFEQKGFRAERVGATPGRPNLLARFGAAAPEKTILFESHLDTVGVAGFAGDPFALREEDTRKNDRTGAPTARSGQGGFWPLSIKTCNGG